MFGASVVSMLSVRKGGSVIDNGSIWRYISGVKVIENGVDS